MEPLAQLCRYEPLELAVIQPLFGWLGDKRPSPWFMALGIFLAGLGMAGIGYMQGYWLVVVSAMVSGIGVAMFHPEGGRLSNLAAGARKGAGMSIFAVGGNIGFFIGPVLCATSLTAFGLHGTVVFLIPATACAILLLAFNRRFKALGTSAESAGKESTAREHWGLFGVVMGVLSLRSILSYGLMAFIPLFLVGVLGQGEAFSSTAIPLFSIAGAIATPGFLSELGELLDVARRRLEQSEGWHRSTAFPLLFSLLCHPPCCPMTQVIVEERKVSLMVSCAASASMVSAIDGSRLKPLI